MPGLSPRDLSTAAIQRFRSLARQSGRVEPGILREAVPSLLEKLKLRDDAYLKRAAALLFHEDPERFVSGAFVKIGFFRSETDLAFHDEVRGDLFTQVATTIDLLRTKYLEAGIRYEGIQRVESFGVPDVALREAVLNALIHRDYAIPAPVQIRVYADRLTIWNPAVLPEGWGLAELLGEHASLPYNPNVANAFFRAGQIEAWGRGIQRIFEACRAAGAPEPRLEASGHELRLQLGYAGDPLGEAGGTPVKTPVKTLVKTPVKTSDAILALLREQPGLRLADVAEALGKSTSAVERATRKLREEGRVRYVGPQKGGRWEVLP
jgi:Predicted transcriptional regulator containing an HTH domain and an uncharacterized domain shared with the mammalian protein Schlafen